MLKAAYAGRRSRGYILINLVPSSVTLVGCAPWLVHTLVRMGSSCVQMRAMKQIIGNNSMLQVRFSIHVSAIYLKRLLLELPHLLEKPVAVWYASHMNAHIRLKQPL